MIICFCFAKLILLKLEIFLFVCVRSKIVRNKTLSENDKVNVYAIDSEKKPFFYYSIL